MKQNPYLKMILFPLSDDSKWLICCRETNLASCGSKQHFFYWLLFRQYQAFDPMWPASAVKHSSSASLLVLSRITQESTSENVAFVIIKPSLPSLSCVHHQGLLPQIWRLHPKIPAGNNTRIFRWDLDCDCKTNYDHHHHHPPQKHIEPWPP